MKRIWVVSLVLLMMGAGTVFGQAKQAASNEKKNAISLDLFQLFKGIIASDTDADTYFVDFSLNYERLIAPHFGLGVQLDLFPGKVFDISYFYFGMSAFFRHYPMSANAEKFFLGTSLGFNVQAVDGKAKPETGGFSGLTVALQAGYRLMLSSNFVYIEPSMSYVLSKTYLVPVVPLGWQGGLRFGLVF
jgi:hypothetical protein